MKVPFEKIQLEQIDSEKCTHEYVQEMSPNGLLPLWRCRKCLNVTSEGKTQERKHS